MPVPTLPPFPDNVPTHPLLIIDYNLLKAKNKSEEDKLWTAATTLGFWYLKNHGVDNEVNAMFDMGEETMNLPLDEKMKYEQGDEGLSFGYKAAGANAVSASGIKDTVEFINIAKDDALSWPWPNGEPPRRPYPGHGYPSTINTRMSSTIVPFIRKSTEINDTIMEVFNTKLGLSDGTLASFHKSMKEEFSASEARVIKSPASLNLNREVEADAGVNSKDEGKMAIGAHTDFGSLSFLHNRLGGLQVLPPGVDEWHFGLMPIQGHAICNVGDALSVFSGGILHSNIHRVVPPPGPQSTLDRWSLVYFTRPGNSVVLRALGDERESRVIKDHLDRLQVDNDSTSNINSGEPEKAETAEEWFMRRIKNQRMNNRRKRGWRVGERKGEERSLYAKSDLQTLGLNFPPKKAVQNLILTLILDRDLTGIISRFNTSSYLIGEFAGRICWTKMNDFPLIQSFQDPSIQRMNDFNEKISVAMIPGAHLVEILPFLQGLPRSFSKWRQDAEEFFEELNAYFERPFLNIKKQVESGQEQRPSFCVTLAENQANSKLSDRECSWLAGALYSAAHETTATSMMWFIFAMILFPEVQTRAQEELDKVVGRSRLPSFADLKHLPYIHAIVKEVLRWRTPLPMGVPHVTSEDDYYDGYYIPKGTICVPDTSSLNHDPDVYGPDAQEFRPERHIDENGQLKDGLLGLSEGHSTYGFGQRICVGRHVANNSLFITIATILWTIRLEGVKDSDGNVVLPDVNAEEENGIFSRPSLFAITATPRFQDADTFIGEARDEVVEENLARL
ncbi:hypothetical protein D9758_005009 [Tetrapyrgos nigripes]|uniref:Fe2OG dioxygenase domain-containing protein n=1 Tax=Tetrapyrgos nigripes TaxID=182062 RepID=A0A8H5GW98_9AGAR|nr:hypothetical protein D9758_005009 [Tetrapyrgos nigripes]